jgi:hypothetical protein
MRVLIALATLFLATSTMACAGHAAEPPKAPEPTYDRAAFTPPPSELEVGIAEQAPAAPTTKKRAEPVVTTSYEMRMISSDPKERGEVHAAVTPEETPDR